MRTTKEGTLDILPLRSRLPWDRKDLLPVWVPLREGGKELPVDRGGSTFCFSMCYRGKVRMNTSQDSIIASSAQMKIELLGIEMEESKLKKGKMWEKGEIGLIAFISHPDHYVSGMVSVVGDWLMHAPKLRIRVKASLHFRTGKDLKDCLFSGDSKWHPLTYTIVISGCLACRSSESMSDRLNQDLCFQKIPRGFLLSTKAWETMARFCTHPIFHASFETDMYILYCYLSPWEKVFTEAVNKVEDRALQYASEKFSQASSDIVVKSASCSAKQIHIIINYHRPKCFLHLFCNKITRNIFSSILMA